jgi:hypothetical protein
MRRGSSGGGGRRNGSPRSQNFDSNGPDIKVRGNAQQVVDKYQALAREAATAGDPVMAENYYQHAEHYYRLMTANGGGDNRHGGRPSDGDRNRDNSGSTHASSGNGGVTEASAADDADENAREDGESAAGKADPEPVSTSAAEPSVEEAGEPLT